VALDPETTFNKEAFMPRPITTKFLDAARALKSADHSPAASEKPALEKHQDLPAPTPPTLDQVVDKILVRFDQNSDQKLTAQELGAVLDPKGRFELINKMVSNLLAKVDTNKDTFVDKTEWTAALSALDKNADGLISRPDLHHGPDALIALVGVIPHHEIPPGG
jgi:hypothetical protein